MRKKKKNDISRRAFIKGCGATCAAMGSLPFFSSFLNLGMISSASAANIGQEYKAMVCILLAGGNDSFNMLVPKGNPEYQEYQSARGDLALGQNDLLSLDVLDGDGREFGLHPGMTELQQLFNNGAASFITNVGTLIEPVANAQEFETRAKLLPLGLFSHADQIEQWQTSLPDKRTGIGWAGKMNDLLQDLIGNNNISMNISLSGTNIFQTGNQTTEFSVSSQGSTSIIGYKGGDTYEQILTQSIDSMLNLEYKNIFEQAYANKLRNSLDAEIAFREAIMSVQSVNTPFSNNMFSNSLKFIANTINARENLGQKRQVFFVLFGGWDHHDDTLPRQQEMLPVISKGLSEFYNALTEMGITDNVATFTTSDFARTLTSNGKGSDHAWGSNQIVVGGGIKGSRIFGNYPVLALNNPLDVGRGVLIPTTSTDEFFAELALWFGVTGSELSSILPNIGRFYDINSGSAPIGFLNI